MSTTQKRVKQSLRFSLRTDAEGSLDEMRQRLERVLGCTFKPGGKRYNWFYFEAEALGMELLLGESCGIARRRIFEFQGGFVAGPDEPLDTEFEAADIDRPIIDILDRRGAGEWRRLG